MLRIVKKQMPSPLKVAGIRTVAVLLSLLTAAALVALLGYDPIKVYTQMILGALGSPYRFTEVLNKAIPLCIIALGISIAFRMKFWNIGAEGQIIMGAFCASFLALKFPTLPQIILLPLMVLAGALGGGLWAFIPAWFKAKFNANETLFTLMLNYIALKWVTYLQYGPWRDPMALGFPKIARFSTNAILPSLFGVHIGWIFALVLVVLVTIFMKYTKKGYEVQVIGESENTARYAGMNVKKIIVQAIFISGALCGLTGMIQASALNNTLSVDIAGGIGFTGIIIAWLAGLSAPVIMVTAFAFSIITQGGSYIQTAMQIPQTIAYMIQ
ncbi:MAG: ABC transporter permease, partial [Hyphomonadaceae bacterium]|nr:ABC transporter permease [Clostridia bacterium]